MEKLEINWIHELIESFPTVMPRRKNLIEIAGYPSWENVHSNLLAFYLNHKEQHLFENFFLECLIECIIDVQPLSHLDLTMFATDYEVKREENFIDILIRQADETNSNSDSNWAIIIENKLYAPLYNNLKKYWDIVNADFKIGVVLTLKPLRESNRLVVSDSDSFINITHKVFLHKIRSNIHKVYDKADDRHLLYLKDFIANIEMHYYMDESNEVLEKNLRIFQSKNEEIMQLEKVKAQLKDYQLQQVFTAFAKIGFIPLTRYVSDNKHFEADRNFFAEEDFSILNGFRFWINLKRLLYENILEIYFELFGDNCHYAIELKEKLRGLNCLEFLNLKIGEKETNSYCHIAKILEKLDSNVSFHSAIEEAVSRFYREEFNLILNCIDISRELQSQK